MGKSFSADVWYLKGNTAAVLLTGASRLTWSTFFLPLDLQPYGAPGCYLRVSWDLAAGQVTNATGIASVPFNLPNDPNLLGSRFYQQWLLVDPQANTLGLITTAGGEAMVGQ